MTTVPDAPPLELTPGAMQTVVERDLGDRGTLRFEEAPRGWLTQKGERRRSDWRCYALIDTDGKRRRMPSASTVLGILEKRALYEWHEAQGILGVLEAIARDELDPSTVHPDDAVTIIRDLGLGAEAAKQKAAKRGLDVHDALETWSRSGVFPNPGDMDPEHRPYLRALASALIALDPEPVAVEQITCSLEHGVAGRFDLLARIGGRLVMVDLKTNRHGVAFLEAHPQVACYAACEQELTGLDIQGTLALGVGPDGRWRADEGCASFDDFLAVLETYRALQRIGNARGALERAAAKAAKEADPR